MGDQRAMVDVLFFAGTREVVGHEREQVEVRGDATVSSLLDALCSRHPGLEPHRPSLRVAVNESYVELSHLLAAGDEVALIPPVAGG
jgi:molybdopterin converting factor subunit 1